jgi:hypothetical protein
MTKTATGACALALTLALAAGGCGGTGTVSGKVTYQGKALPGGLVTCMTKENRPYYGTIAADGTYAVAGVPAGPVTVSVESRPADGEPPVPLPDKDQPPARPAAPNPKPPPAVPIPRQYSKPDSSGLSLTVVRGTNPFDIDLK